MISSAKRGSQRLAAEAIAEKPKNLGGKRSGADMCVAHSICDKGKAKAKAK